MNSLYFSQPFVLALLIIPLLMWIWAKNKHSNQKLKLFADAHLWQWIMRNPKSSQRPLRSTLFALATALAILAAAGPVYFNKNDSDIKYSGNDIVLIADISNSMSVTDVLPNRLQYAKLELNALLKKLNGNRLGLVVFSSQAYSVLPLTHDIDTVRTFVSTLDTGLSRYRGSHLSSALDKAADMLAKSKIDSRAIILVTDGDIHDAEQSLNIAKEFGKQQLPIFILSSGANFGGPVKESGQGFISHQGNIVTSRLNSSLITALARNSHGISTLTDNKNPNALLDAVNRLKKNNSYPGSNASVPQQLYHWPLIFSLILFLYLGMPNINVLALLLFFLPGIMLSNQADAASLQQYLPWQEQQAYQALQKDDYDTALKGYRNHSSFNSQMGAGAAAYRSKQWLQAEKYFRNAFFLAKSSHNKAKAIYNVGNTLLHTNQHDAAKTAYEQATMLDAKFKNAIINLKLLNSNMALSKQEDHEKTTKQTALKKQTSNDKKASFSNTLSGNQLQNTSTMSAPKITQQKINQTLKKWYPENSNIDPQVLAIQHQTQSILNQQTTILQQRINNADQRNTPMREAKPW